MKVEIIINAVDGVLSNEFPPQYKFEIERPAVDEARGGFHIGSRAKVCPRCLNIWAVMRVLGDTVFGVDSQFCEHCADSYINGVPGSLLDDRQSWTVDWDLIRYLPEPLLHREFELHVRTFLKEDSHERTSNSDPCGVPAAFAVANTGAFTVAGGKCTS